MWQVCREALRWLDGLDRHELSLLMILVVAIGFLCLRGRNARSHY